MVAKSSTRVIDHSSEQATARIREAAGRRVAYYAEHRDEIGKRIEELDAEWDIERVLEAGSSALTLTGIALALGVDRRFLILSLVVQGFFMQHVLQGWCPPLPLFRNLGVRTQYEIEQERYALKALRGDFEDTTNGEVVFRSSRV